MSWRDVGTFEHDGKTFDVKAAEAMHFIQWELFEDYDLAIPEHLEPHRGHRYVVAAWSALGWDFDKWNCGQCDVGWKAER